MKLLTTTLGSLVLLALASASNAVTTLTLDNCDAFGCEGSTLKLSVDDQGGGSWLVTYTINTDGYTGSRTGLNQVAFKAISGWSDATLLSAPNGVSNWSDVIEAAVSSNALCGGGNLTTDKICVYAKNSLLDITGGGDFTWTFQVVGGTLLPTDDWYLGGQYASAVGTARGHIISAEQAIPEPSAAMLFGVGAILVARRTRRA